MVVKNEYTNKPRVAVVIPCYAVGGRVVEVVRGIPAWIDEIIAVDDACPEGSARVLEARCEDPRLKIVRHDRNRGVGAAMATGYRAALASGCDVVVKMDGDGQMNPRHLEALVEPILAGEADFTKGNRFYDLAALRAMPAVRRFGNLGLTFLAKAASGYWNVADPANGYTAVHAAALRLLNLDHLSRRFFFENSMLIQLNIVRALAVDVPMPARYAGEKSSLRTRAVLLGFPPRLMLGFVRRLIWRYFIYDINAVTVLLLGGGCALAFGVGFGAYRWILGHATHEVQSAGTVAVALLPTLLGFQMLLQAVLFDVTDRPKSALCRPAGTRMVRSRAPFESLAGK
jgi:glycosyltransferase involved in cell wall biosynthesis